MAQQIWATSTLGGYATNNRLSKIMREQAQPMFAFRQFVQVKEGGSGKGDTVYFDKSLAMDTKGGTLAETSTIPANLSKMQKGSVQVTEYGNGIAFSEKLDTLAEFNMKNQYSKWLVNDHKKVTDSVCATQFKTARFRAVATSTSSTVFTTNSVFTATANANASDKTIRDVVDYLKQKWVPKYGGGKDYIGIVSVNTQRGVYDFLQAIMQYTTPEFTYNSELGRYYNCRMVEDTAYLSDSVGTGSVFGEGIFFGDEAVMEAVALPEEIRYEEKDFGRDKRLAWYGILGWTKMWDLSNDDLNSTGKGIERIVYLGSA